MASYNSSFTSWSGFEAILTAAQAFQSSATYASVMASLSNLQAHAALSVTPENATSTSATLNYGDGVVAHLLGFNFGTAGAVVTHIDIADGLAIVSLDGFVGAQDLSGNFNSYSYSGFGYSESGTGQIPLSSPPTILSSWSSTLPTELGSVLLSATGTSVISGDTASNTYASVTVSDSAGHSAALTGLNFQIAFGRSSAPDYVQIMHDMLSGNDAATGNGGDEGLRTFNGDDTLDGMAGADTMEGGPGDDIYAVDELGDVVNELPGEGVDRIQASVSCTLPANVENLTLIGFNQVSAYSNGIGNDLDNTLTTTVGAHYLNGMAGNDIFVSGGQDFLVGGPGIDTVVLPGPRGNYQLKPIAGGYTLGSLTLSEMEYARFSDETLYLGDYPPEGIVQIRDYLAGALLTGAPASSRTLYASASLSDFNGLGSFSYQWKADGNAIAGATTLTFTPTLAEVGKRISVTISYTDLQGTFESVSSSATAPAEHVNAAPIVNSYPRWTASPNEALSIRLGMLFSDPDGDALVFSATGLPDGIEVDAVTGRINGAAPAASGTHHVALTATDPSGASSSLQFDLVVTPGHTLTTTVVTRSGTALPGVTAYEFASDTPSGSLYGFRNMTLDTAINGTRVLSSDVVTTGGGDLQAIEFSLYFTSSPFFHGFQVAQAIDPANGWLVSQGTLAGAAWSYTLAASRPGETIPGGTLIGRLNLEIPFNYTYDQDILYFSQTSLAAPDAIRNDIRFNRVELGGIGQLNATLPDSNLAISLERGTGDLIVAGRKPITAADALDALKLSVGLAASQGSSWKELIAADINHDGRVTAADALEILKVSVGINTIQASWVFVPDDASVNPNLASMTKSTVTYKDDLNYASITESTSTTITGILVGDVNNSWVIPT